MVILQAIGNVKFYIKKIYYTGEGIILGVNNKERMKQKSLKCLFNSYPPDINVTDFSPSI